MRKLFIAVILLAAAFATEAETPLNLESQRGNVVLLDFWASWCVPCRRSFPWMNEMQQRYADDGLKIIAVNLDRKLPDAESFLEVYPAGFEIHLDPDGKLAKTYGIEVMPTSILFDRNGNILERHAGFKVQRQDEYEQIIRAALGLESET